MLQYLLPARRNDNVIIWFVSTEITSVKTVSKLNQSTNHDLLLEYGMHHAA